MHAPDVVIETVPDVTVALALYVVPAWAVPGFVEVTVIVLGKVAVGATVKTCEVGAAVA